MLFNLVGVAVCATTIPQWKKVKNIKEKYPHTGVRAPLIFSSDGHWEDQCWVETVCRYHSFVFMFPKMSTNNFTEPVGEYIDPS